MFGFLIVEIHQHGLMKNTTLKTEHNLKNIYDRDLTGCLK